MVESDQAEKARPLIAGLASEIHAEPQAYAKIVEGNAFRKNGDARQAIKVLTEANGLLDTWIGHFDLGRAYFDAGQFAQADSEFDRCIKRRGEAMSLFLDEEPTYAYLPSVYYYQGRIREAMKTSAFAESYLAYINIRGKSTEDPLLAEVRRHNRNCRAHPLYVVVAKLSRFAVSRSSSPTTFRFEVGAVDRGARHAIDL